MNNIKKQNDILEKKYPVIQGLYNVDFMETQHLESSDKHAFGSWGPCNNNVFQFRRVTHHGELPAIKIVFITC